MKRRPRPDTQGVNGNSPTLPKYTIGVVSQLLGLPPQVLRRYEEAGLLEPARQSGKNRLYSDQDIAILEEIAELSEQGVNAIGIRHIIQIRKDVTILQQEIKEMREALHRYEEERVRIEMSSQSIDMDSETIEMSSQSVDVHAEVEE
ncbi:MAG TPA: MerR family transcriptional regulator [Ktedonobacteraceae bacterium]|nr:MerR family transcriptional regulator [Ktedonobacteraceae bacterium]